MIRAKVILELLVTGRATQKMNALPKEEAMLELVRRYEAAIQSLWFISRLLIT